MGSIIDVPTNLGLRPPEPGCVPGADKAPQALRAAGLHAALCRQGWIDGPPVLAGRYHPEMSPGQVRNQAAIVEHAHRLASRVAQALDRGERPLVLGGDCSTLLGVGLGLAARGRYGLVHLDGHTDFRHPGNASQPANLAGEDLACAVGLHYPELSQIDGLGPYFEPQDVVHAGCRDDDAHLDEARGQLGAVVSASQWVADPRGALAAIVAWTERDGLDGFWVHVDVDVLDPAYMPAVDSPDPGGISPSLLSEALAGLWPRAAGMTVGILDPDLDPDGQYAGQVASIILGAVAGSGPQAKTL
ncbi:arginase family protein [Mobilicoccus sp.]|uniref:arginase family protein n=1 Tax=Mobilicoccus sp. TaxID=2034349 RepID=UPI0028A72E63|nr:arginase family protein [Mobilicoccus sp.]